MIQAVRDVRLSGARRGRGKAILHLLLAAQGIVLSVSMVGRILSDLKEWRQIHEPRVPRGPKSRPARPYAIRRSTVIPALSVPGDVVQIDTVHVRPLAGPQRRKFTAIDAVCRCAVVGIRSQSTAGTAAAFLEELETRMPAPVQAIQMDGGSEFIAEFEHSYRDRGTTFYALLPRISKLDGRMERMNRTCRREF